MVAAGLFGRWGEEKRMRKVHAPCQIEGERAQFKFANVSATAPCRPSARPQMARVDTHKICSVRCRRGTSSLFLIGRLELFGESKEHAGKRARSGNAGSSHPFPPASTKRTPGGIQRHDARICLKRYPPRVFLIITVGNWLAERCRWQKEHKNGFFLRLLYARVCT